MRKWTKNILLVTHWPTYAIKLTFQPKHSTSVLFLPITCLKLKSGEFEIFCIFIHEDVACYFPNLLLFRPLNVIIYSHSIPNPLIQIIRVTGSFNQWSNLRLTRLHFLLTSAFGACTNQKAHDGKCFMKPTSGVTQPEWLKMYIYT